jgi:hypothetical protein
MQRRVWTYLGIADIMFSFQVGFRSMIKLSDIVSNLPHNIHDDYQFQEHIEDVPVSLPAKEITNISFMIVKARLCMEFAKMLEELSRAEPISYSRVLEIDKRLRRSYDDIPEHYKLHTLSRTNPPPLTLIASRFMLANLHQKSICVLHSRYLGLSRHDLRFIYSRRSCLEAAMQLLSFQAIQHEQSTTRGSIHNLNKYQTSLTTHDFLLAAALISVELSFNVKHSPFEGRSDAGPSRRELITAMERSVKIWDCLRDRSAEAFKAADVLNMLLHKFKGQDSLLTHFDHSAKSCASSSDANERTPQPQWWQTKLVEDREPPVPRDLDLDHADASTFWPTLSTSTSRIGPRIAGQQTSPPLTSVEPDSAGWDVPEPSLSNGPNAVQECFSQTQVSWFSFRGHHAR